MLFGQNRTRHVKNKKQQNKEFFENLDLEKRTRKAERAAFIDGIAGKFMLSPEMLHNVSLITLSGRSSIRIENYKRILEYQPTCIKIQANDSAIMVEGKNLIIRYYTKEEMIISGILSAVSFV